MVDFLDGYGTGDELNYGLVNDQIPMDQYSAQPEGVCVFGF